jgi:hypothetical protein
MAHPRRPAFRIGWSAMLVALLLAGCSGAGHTIVTTGKITATAVATAVATATPTTAGALPIHSMDLGAFQANYAMPVDTGLVLRGNPGTTPLPVSPDGNGALYYYDNATHHVTLLASLTPTPGGAQRNINIAQAAGTWVVYDVADAVDENWEIWALDLRTKQRQLVASAVGEQRSVGFHFGLVTDGTSLVWSHAVVDNGQLVTRMALYDLTSGASRTLMTLPATTNVVPAALYAGSLVFVESPPQPTPAGGINNGYPLPLDTVWLWKLADPAPAQIATPGGLNYIMDDRYIIWDDWHTQTVALYDRAAGKQHDGFVTGCIDPGMAPGLPYVICTAGNKTQSYQLVRLPTGERQTIATHRGFYQRVAVADGRAYWVEPASTGFAGDHVDYIEIPTV